MLSKELINELKIILKEDYNLELSYEELATFGTKLVGYIDLLAKIQHRNIKDEQVQP